MRGHRAAVMAAGTVVLLLAACGTDPGPAAGPVTSRPETTGPGTTGPGTSGRGTSGPETSGPGTTVAEAGGWVGGEPDFSSTGDEMLAAEAGGGALPSAAPTAEAGAAGDDAGATDVAAGPPRAGSVDDNADYAGFLAYLTRIDSLGLGVRRVDLADRVVVRVVGADGRTVPGTEVAVSAAGAEVARLRTASDGTVRFFPHAWAAPAGPYTFGAGGASVQAEAGGAVDLVLPGPAPAVTGVPIDVLFALDATGSMGDEIDRLKGTIGDVAARIGGIGGVADVRLGMTVYRDEGDTFVTATYDFATDVAAFATALDAVVADGGGDTPEALDEALAEAFTTPAWRPAGEALQVVVLVADAAAHHDRAVQAPWTVSVRDAAARGITVLPIASSSSDDAAEATFRPIAALAGARFVFLSYGAAGAATGGATDIDSTDYEELPLDELVVRLVAEQVAARTGGDVVIPPSPSTTTPTTQGQ